jgi:hypothetical protein
VITDHDELAHSGTSSSMTIHRLSRELLDIQVVERGNGLRIDHPRDGHDDRAIALAMAAHVRVGLAPDETVLGPDEFRALSRVLPLRTKRPPGLGGPFGW